MEIFFLTCKLIKGKPYFNREGFDAEKNGDGYIIHSFPMNGNKIVQPVNADEMKCYSSTLDGGSSYQSYIWCEWDGLEKAKELCIKELLGRVSEMKSFIFQKQKELNRFQNELNKFKNSYGA